MPEDKNKEKVVDTTTSPTEEEIRKERETKNQQEVEQLKKDYEQTIADTQGVYDSQINGLADLAGAVDAKIKERKEQDENYRKRENAYRYIAGVGDAISGVANLIGTAHGASNQQQTYNAPALVQKAEESRKARKLEMDDLSNRIDEMRSREKELRSAKDLKTAELRAQQNREVRELKMKQDEIAREDEWKAMQNAINMMNAQANLNRSEATLNSSNKPSSKATPKYVPVIDSDGKTTNFDVSGFKDFWGDYQRALDTAITNGTSGLSNEEIEAYNKASKLAEIDNNKALKEFLRTHTPRKHIVQTMIQNPIFGSL